MDASEPRVRHRGYFLNSAGNDDTDPAEEAAAEGVKVRVRIVRPRAKRRAAGAIRRTPLKGPRPGDRQSVGRRPPS